MSNKSSKVPLNNTVLPQQNESVLVKNETLPGINNSGSFLWTTQLNQGTITTGFYILAALSSVVVMYFVFRAIRLRRRNYKVRRYGVIASREDVEMTPLENEDDDEDSTVFDISMKSHSRS